MVDRPEVVTNPSTILELPGVNKEDDDSDNEDYAVEQVAVEGDCFC